MQYKNRHPLIIGTLILTATGLVTRVIGFFYRIYLSRLFGEEGMGIYQLLSPVLSLSFSLTAAGYQTAISKFVAAQSAKDTKASYRPMLVGLSISLPLSLLCTAIVFFGAEYIGTYLLLEMRTVSMLRILAFSIPFSAIHSCINGYFYGTKRAGIPAISQLVEQLTRVGCVYGVSGYALSHGTTPTINVAVLGLAVGELISMMVSVISIYFCYAQEHNFSLKHIPDANATISAANRVCLTDDTGHAGKCLSSYPFHNLLPVYKSILSMALPLTANRIVLNLLQSLESVSIPARLRLYGYDTTTSLSVYGVLTGMAMPLIFFPNALTGSIAVLLLPMISESHALGDMKAVKASTLRTVKYCLLMGICCMLVFVLLGDWAGRTMFDSALAGHFISTLGFICPFMYLDTTLSSILQGLGLAGHIFAMNVSCLLLRLLFVFFFVPRIGITGYLWGILASQLLLSLLYLICLYRFFRKH